MSEILETRGDLRVRLVRDDYPDEPYDDGHSPILRLYPLRSWGGWRADHIDTIGGHTPAGIGEIVTAAEKWAGNPDLFGRYLRMFHGTTEVQWYDGRQDGADYVYVTFDTADWREHHQIAPEQREVIDMSEWRAYCEGDVYGYVIEQRTTWRRDGSTETRQSWETVDSCWGFYGNQYAEQAAREAFEDLTSNLATTLDAAKVKL